METSKWIQITKQSFWAGLYFGVLSLIVLFVAPTLLTPSNTAFLLYVIIVLVVVLETMSVWYQRKRGVGLMAMSEHYAVMAFLAAIVLVYVFIPMFSSSIAFGTPLGIIAFAVLVIPSILVIEILWAFYDVLLGKRIES